LKPPIRNARAFSSRPFVLILAPLLFLGLTFVQHIVFLNDIDGALLLVSCLGVVALLAAYLAEHKRNSIQAYLDSLPVRRLSRRLFLLSFLIYGLYASGLVFPALPFTGDEPHYLLVTRSLVADGDLNLAEDYKNREYKAFYDGELKPHASPGKKGERFLYSRHLPALSVLIAPFYIAGKKAARPLSALALEEGGERTILVFFSRLPICLLTALLGLVFFLSAWELTQNRGAALKTWLIFSFSSPLLFYSQLIYPELPVALILAAVAYGLILKKKTSSRTLFWAGAGIGILPWFGIKYIPLAGAAFLIVLFLAAKAGRIKTKAALSFLAPLAASAGLFLLFLHSLFGRISPQSVYLGSARGADWPLSRFLVKGLAGFSSSWLAFLLDQRIGLIIYAPVLILGLAGFYLLWKRRPEPACLLGGLFVAFWIFCSATLYWGGFCPPGRPLLPVIWIPALFLAVVLANEGNKTALVIRKALVVLSFFFVFVALPHPRLLYQDSMTFLLGPGHPELPSRLLSSLDGLLIDWTKWVPTLATTVREQKTWGLALVWVIAMLTINLVFLRKKRAKSPEAARLGLKGNLALVVFLGMVFVTLSFFDVRLENGFAVSGGDAFAQDENSLGPELGGLWVRGESKATLVIRTERPLSRLSVRLQSPVEGKTTVQLGNKTQEARRPSRNMDEQVLLFSSPRPFRWKGRCLYTLQVKEKGGFYPYNIDMNSRDKRFLGVFVRIDMNYGHELW
jgi:hypothetical protein